VTTREQLSLFPPFCLESVPLSPSSYRTPFAAAPFPFRLSFGWLCFPFPSVPCATSHWHSFRIHSSLCRALFLILLSLFFSLPSRIFLSFSICLAIFPWVILFLPPVASIFFLLSLAVYLSNLVSNTICRRSGT